MSCKNCIHYEKCHSINLDFADSVDPNHICQFFKNKFDFAEVKHAHWVLNKHQAADEKSYCCSLCAEGGSDFGFDAYCNACGAKMERYSFSNDTTK